MKTSQQTMEEVMGEVAGRIIALQGLVLGGAIAVTAFLPAIAVYAQNSESSAPSKPTAFSGCVQRASGSDKTLAISSPTVCATLKGKFADEKLIGHEVDLKGVLTQRTASVAASIEVESVQKVGGSCSDVCKLQPPGTRGLRPPKDHEIPGSEGGTPGVAVPPHN